MSQSAQNNEIEVVLYNGKQIERIDYSTYIREKDARESDVVWINVDKEKDQAQIDTILKPFGVHPLIIEDILLEGQRPKLETYEEYAYLNCKMIYFDGEELAYENLSILFDQQTVITIGDHDGDVFSTIRKRLEVPTSNLRLGKADHLVYAILDAIVDAYFDVLETLGDLIDAREEDLLVKPNMDLLTILRQYKRDLLYLHKAIWPLREVLSRMINDEPKEIRKETVPYLRDVYDHIYQCIDSIETYRELLSGMMDLYLSSISNRMNEIMKVLTIISTIFIPLTFIAGVYGMNFHYMPELTSQWGYPLTLLFMAILALLMVYYFKRKKWF